MPGAGYIEMFPTLSTQSQVIGGCDPYFLQNCAVRKGLFDKIVLKYLLCKPQVSQNKEVPAVPIKSQHV